MLKENTKPSQRRERAKMNEMIIGSHLSLGGPDYFVGTVREAVKNNETAFMFYTGAPQNTVRLPLNRLKIEEGRELLKTSGIKEDNLVVHAPYIINLGNTINPDIGNLAVSFLSKELERTAAFGVKNLVLHPGSGLSAPREEAIATIAKRLDIVLSNDNSDVRICLETMAGKGSEIGNSFEEIAAIIALCENKDRLRVCLDTCHINDAGMDDKDIDSILKHFDSVIGLDKLAVIHLNDSKNVMGSHKDRHENIGYGNIGFETLHKWASDPRLENIPKILETPFFEEKSPYAKEIAMLRSGVYEEGWRDLI